MRIAILGTGVPAGALGGRWASAGHDVTVAGRSLDKACALAASLGTGVRAEPLPEAVRDSEAVLPAVTWSGVADILHAANASAGALAGVTLIDPTNAVDDGVGVLNAPSDTSGAQHIAQLAPEAHVVKAFHLFPAQQWSDPAGTPVTVAVCGDDPHAVRVTETLIGDAGAEAAVLGGLERARQLEEAAGFIIGLAFHGVDPRSAVPQVPTR